MTMRALKSSDESVVTPWLRDYLQVHRAWWSAAYGTEPQVSLADLAAHNWQDLLDARENPEVFVGVLESELNPIGIVQAQIAEESYLGVKAGILNWIYVDADFRGQGAADALLNAAHDWMTQQGAVVRQVFVTAENSAAVRLYERHGYAVIDYRMLAPG